MILFNVGIAGFFGSSALSISAMKGLPMPVWPAEVLFWGSLAMPMATAVGVLWLLSLLKRSSATRTVAGTAGRVVRIVISVPVSVLVLAWLGCAYVGPSETPRTELRRPGMILYSERYNIHVLGIEKLFVFDVNKYGRIRDELVRLELRSPDDFLVPESLTEEQLLRVHTLRYLKEIESPGKAARYLEFPLAALIPGPVYRSRALASFKTTSGGTLLAARVALEHGLAVNLAGGYAHASTDAGGGFCLIADVPIAIRVLQNEGKLKRVLIIDTDCHHGEGNAQVFADDESVRIIDFYQDDIYPALKETVWLNVPFDAGIIDDGYMKLLTRHVGPALDEFKPDLVMFVMGSDIYETDPLTDTRISKAGVLKRDLYVVDECRKRNIPVAMTLSGGYSTESWQIHAEGIAELIRKYDKAR